MIIDLILDRKHGFSYSPREFYVSCMKYSSVFDGIGDAITRAMDYGEEQHVRHAICKYILEGGYNPEICDYVNQVHWLD